MIKKDLFLWYVKIDAWRLRGGYWKDTLFGYLSINTIIQGVTVGGILKLTMFQNLPMWTFVMFIVIGGLALEFVKMLIGWIDFHYGIWERQAEWGQKQQQNAPFNKELVATLNNICDKLGVRSEFKDL